VSLGKLTGAVSLKETLSVTETAAGGVGVSYVVADPLVEASPLLTSPAAALADPRVALRSDGGALTESRRGQEFSAALWRFDSADVAVGKYRTEALLRIPERRSERLKVQRR